MQVEYVKVLLNFKSYFVTKYNYFGLDEMWRKQDFSLNQIIYIKKCFKFENE